MKSYQTILRAQEIVEGNKGEILMKDSDLKMIKIIIETSLEIIRAEDMDNFKVSSSFMYI